MAHSKSAMLKINRLYTLASCDCQSANGESAVNSAVNSGRYVEVARLWASSTSRAAKPITATAAAPASAEGKRNAHSLSPASATQPFSSRW